MRWGSVGDDSAAAEPQWRVLRVAIGTGEATIERTGTSRADSAQVQVDQMRQAFWQFAFWLRLQGNGRAALPTQFTVCTVKPQGRFLECAPLTVCCVHRHELQRGHSSRLDPQPLIDLGLGRVGWLVESLDFRKMSMRSGEREKYFVQWWHDNKGGV